MATARPYDATIRTDVTLRITGWSAQAEQLFGYSEWEVIGQALTLLSPAANPADEASLLERVTVHGAIETMETVRTTKAGVPVNVLLTCKPVRDGGGVITGVGITARELSEQDRTDRALRRLAAIVESSDDAIISKDLSGIMTSWNRSAERMFGYSASEMIGRSIRRIIPADRQREEDEVLARIRSGEKVDHFETIRRRKDGSPIEISLTVSPIRDRDGRVIGASKIARDISDRRVIEAERARFVRHIEEQSRVTETLNDVGRVVTSTLERNTVVQAVTDAATIATGAAFGAFFYNIADAQAGKSYELYALSGAPLEAFAAFPHPRATAIFAPTYRGDGIVRIDDVTRDPRYGQNPPYHGMPPGHLPVKSYLAVPVTDRTGAVIGGLFFGHPEAGQFTAMHERIAGGIASWAAVALENAALYVVAQNANRLKDEFLATLSHELRTPLNAILGYSRMVRAGLMSGEKQQRAIETIERNATSLTQIVEDVLDVSRIISGKMRLHVQEVDLSSVIGGAIDAVIPAADAKGVRVERILEGPGVSVSGDPDRLQQVVWNLLSNAVKYTPRGGRVQVSLLRVNSHAEVVVSDTGIGIHPDFLPHMFERFRQADGGITRERGGLGLGLSIAKDLIELHGGTIEAASAGTDLGATFRVKLPIMVVTGTSSESRVHPQADRQASVAVPDLHGVRVLAVDDEDDGRRLVREVLETAGASVLTAASAEDALELLGREIPDAIIADLGMPRMDGFEFIARVRASPHPALQIIPAAALTAYARSEDRARALQSGFQLHLAKPIDPSELMAAVASLVRRFVKD
jgi:PAS domain S-box-containing protein